MFIIKADSDIRYYTKTQSDDKSCINNKCI
jgi:hypothetical protein